MVTGGGAEPVIGTSGLAAVHGMAQRAEHGDPFVSDQVTIERTTPRQRHTSGLAFVFAVPIAVLGGLIGLGGAEFRLPVLVGPLGHPPRRAVPLNLAVSLATIAAALAVRSRSLSLEPSHPWPPPSSP
jgi:hypothetical protein